MEESLNALDEKKIFLKEALEEWQIDQKTYDKMINTLDEKKEEQKNNWEQYNFLHSKPMKTFFIILFLIVIIILFLNAVKVRVNLYWKVMI